MDQPKAKSWGELIGTLVAGYVFIGLLAWGGWEGVSWMADAIKGHSTANASANDPRDQQIKELSAKVIALEQQKPEHHYELRNEGTRSFRFDPATGESCVELASKSDWKRPETIRQGCQYQDYIADHSAGTNVELNAECLFIGTKTACHALGLDALAK